MSYNCEHVDCKGLLNKDFWWYLSTIWHCQSMIIYDCITWNVDGFDGCFLAGYSASWWISNLHHFYKIFILNEFNRYITSYTHHIVIISNTKYRKIIGSIVRRMFVRCWKAKEELLFIVVLVLNSEKWTQNSCTTKHNNSRKFQHERDMQAMRYHFICPKTLTE